MEVKQIIAEIKEKMDQRGGLKHMYFVACGGSQPIPAMSSYMRPRKN